MQTHTYAQTTQREWQSTSIFKIHSCHLCAISAFLVALSIEDGHTLGLVFVVLNVGFMGFIILMLVTNFFAGRVFTVRTASGQTIATDAIELMSLQEAESPDDEEESDAVKKEATQHTDDNKNTDTDKKSEEDPLAEEIGDRYLEAATEYKISLKKFHDAAMDWDFEKVPLLPDCLLYHTHVRVVCRLKPSTLKS